MPVHLLEATRISPFTTRYLLLDENYVLYFGNTGDTVEQVQLTNPNTLRRSEGFSADTIYPQYDKKWTVCDDPDADNVFIKSQRFLGNDWMFLRAPEHFIALWKREIEVGELLLKNPHHNICAYKGVVLDDEDRVIGLAYKRYAHDLSYVYKNNQPIDVDHVIKSISKGMKHMHRLGLVHCDIRPENIFMSGKEVVLGDFDSTHKVRQQLEHKVGARQWWHNGRTWGDKVEKDIDCVAVKSLREYLEKDERTKRSTV